MISSKHIAAELLLLQRKKQRHLTSSFIQKHSPKFPTKSVETVDHAGKTAPASHNGHMKQLANETTRSSNNWSKNS
jgi:hypothetical protein